MEEGVRKKNLLIATDTFPPRVDGVSKFLQQAVPKLIKDFNITILAPDFGPSGSELEGIEGVRIVKFRVGKKSWGELKLAHPSFFKILKEVKNSDIVFVQSIAPVGILTVFAAKILRKNVVAYTHVIEWQIVVEHLGFKGLLRTLVQWFVKIVAIATYRNCSLILTPSQEIAEIFSQQHISVRKEIVPLGIDTSKFSPPVDRRAAKLELSINPDSVVVGYCGRLAKEKDLVTLYRAFIHLRRRYPNVILLIVGDGLPEIRNLFKDREGVYLTGVRNDPVPFYQAMDIFVMPSITETSSLATMEAMSCEVAVIATRVGNISDYLINYETGLFFKKRNSFDLVKKLETLIKREDLRIRLGKNARREISAKFSLDSSIARISKTLKELCVKG
ncbi:MAG: glycosyltransferase family 4 protein [Candidatus Woesearchaeota archaeon]